MSCPTYSSKPRVVWEDIIKVDVRDIVCGWKRDETGCDCVQKWL